MRPSFGQLVDSGQGVHRIPYDHGGYANPPALPAFAGGGVLGRIAALGRDVRHLKPGDRVIVLNTERSAWRERFVWPAARLIGLPEADPVDLALLA